MPVIVVIGVNHIESADLAGQARRFCPFRERAVAIVVEVAQWIHRGRRGDHQIDQSVTIEILRDHAAGVAGNVQSDGGRDVMEPPGIVIGIVDFRRDLPFCGKLVLFPKRHRCQVEQPLGVEVSWIPVEHRRVFPHRPSRAVHRHMNRGSVRSGKCRNRRRDS